MAKSLNKLSQKKEAVWLFAGGTMQQLMAVRIKERGFKLIITDGNKDCFCAKYADEIVHLDTFDIKGNVKISRELSKKYAIKAVLTAGADCHETVAHVAKALNLHGIDPKISHICRYKDLTRAVLTKAGIPQPKFKNAKTLDEARKAIKEIGLPVAIKATNNSGSRGFSKIEKEKELTKEVFYRALENGTSGYVIVEELMIPVEDEIAEQSVETLWYDGKMYWLNWVDRLFRKDLILFNTFKNKSVAEIAWGIELAHINPAVHDFSVKEEIRDMIYKSGLALGLGKQKGGHLLKVDMMLTTKGPRIIELTPRLSGGWDSSMTTPLRGADFVGGILALALGEKLTVDLWYKYFEYQNPAIFSSIFAFVPKESLDCVGRMFAVGKSFDREGSLHEAYKNMLKKDFVPKK